MPDHNSNAVFFTCFDVVIHSRSSYCNALTAPFFWNNFGLKAFTSPLVNTPPRLAKWMHGLPLTSDAWRRYIPHLVLLV